MLLYKKSLIKIIFFIFIIILLFFSISGKKEKKWRAIIAFSNTNEVSEDWNWFFNDIENACKNKGIYVIYAGPDDNKVKIGEGKKPLAVIDISKYLLEKEIGYLFIENGEKIIFQEYNYVSIVLENASNFFNIEL